MLIVTILRKKYCMSLTEGGGRDAAHLLLQSDQLLEAGEAGEVQKEAL